ncbi:MAG: HD domain-containing phosphohydrolase, partial [Pseudomonadota bacterium]
MKIIPWDEFRRQQRGEYQLTIAPDGLRIGDFVIQIEALVPPIDFPKTGRRVESFADKDWYVTRCRRVVIDLEISLNRRLQGIDATLSIGVLPPIPDELDGLRRHGITAKRLVEAWPVYRCLWRVAQAQVLSFYRHGRIDVQDATDAVGELVDAMPQYLSALMWFTRIKEPARYPFQHGVNAAILAAAFCHVARWEPAVAEAVAISALVHDLGMMRVSLEVLRKAGPLSVAEREHIQLHTRIGFELLSQADGLPEISATVALCHQERPDGQGYPEGLTQTGIPAMARLIATISAYDAMTTTHHQHRALSHQQALGELWRLKGKQFD